MKKILSFFLFLFLLIPASANANEKFATYYNVKYNIDKDSNTIVTFDIDLRNKTSETYVSSYIIQTGYTDIRNVSVKDSKGDANFTTEEKEKGTAINIKFNQNVVGINNTQKFTVSFETNEIAKNYGNMWEVNIPGVSSQEAYQAFNVEVTTPKEFGTPTFIKPNVKNTKINNNTIRFNKEELGKSGISISYGEKQIYKFNLKYHLKNSNLIPLTQTIAIPSNNNYQKVYIEKMNPKPIDVKIDVDGNWIASYRLKAFQRIDVEVIGFAEVSYKPRVEGVTKEQRELYLKPQKYWESNDPEIKKLASQLKTPEAIFDYVVNNLKYDKSRINEDKQVRVGAANILKNKTSAVCLEFTDLFIALSRAAGIPARAVEGYANTSNSNDRPLSLFKDVLHAWPEYYDEEKQTWVMVDPTWQNTTNGIDYFNTFDFDHFAFVIKGADSQSPISAGGYRLPDTQNLQDVIVDTSSEFPEPQTKISLRSSFSKQNIAGLPIKGSIIIGNSGGTLLPSETFSVESTDLSPAEQNLHFDKIPPFGFQEVPLKFNALSSLTKESAQIKITFRDSQVSKNIYISPFFENTNLIILFIGVILFSVISIGLSFYIRRSRRVPVS